MFHLVDVHDGRRLDNKAICGLHLLAPQVVSVSQSNRTFIADNMCPICFVERCHLAASSDVHVREIVEEISQ